MREIGGEDGIGISPSATALYRLASLVALVGKNSPPDCFLPQGFALLPPGSNPYSVAIERKKPPEWVARSMSRGYEKDIFVVLLTGFELHRLSYILFCNSFRYCCKSNIRCLFGCQKNRCGNIQTQYNHYQYAFQSRYINSPRNLSTNDQNRN